MNRNLQNLERLCQEMQSRYGEKDTVVVALFEELAAKKLKSSQTQHWTANYELNSATRAVADTTPHR